MIFLPGELRPDCLADNHQQAVWALRCFQGASHPASVHGSAQGGEAGRDGDAGRDGESEGLDMDPREPLGGAGELDNPAAPVVGQAYRIFDRRVKSWSGQTDP